MNTVVFKSKFNLSHPQIPIQRPVLNCFAQVSGGDVRRGFDIRDGAGNFEDAVVCAGAQVQLVHGHAQKFDRFVVELAVSFEGFAAHPGVATRLGRPANRFSE